MDNSVIKGRISEHSHYVIMDFKALKLPLEGLGMTNFTFLSTLDVKKNSRDVSLHMFQSTNVHALRNAQQCSSMVIMIYKMCLDVVRENHMN